MVAEVERIPLSAVWDLTTINFLNDLLYIKMKRIKDGKVNRAITS